jgi:hypothetical protein
MAASILLPNSNRHRACIKTAYPECEYKLGGEQRNQEQQQKQKPYEGKSEKQTLDTTDLLIENALRLCDKTTDEKPVRD